MDVRTPAARAGDTDTSHEAAEHITQSGARQRQAEQALALVMRYPNHTVQELAQYGVLNRDALSRRLPELITAGKLEKGRARTCNVSGRSAHTWHVVAVQRPLL